MTAITTAARLLREAAAELKNAHTLGGDWGNEHEALDAYNEHMATATTLEHMARQCLAQIEEPAGAAPAAVAAQGVVAWMHPETLDVIHTDRKHEWATRYGSGGHSKAEGYTVALVRADQSAADTAPALEAPAAPAGFESWCKAVGGHFARTRCGTHKQDALTLASLAWHAALAAAPQAPAAPLIDGEGCLSDELRELITGMTVSVDVSTGEHDAGNRLFGEVTEVMEYDGGSDKHKVVLLVQSPEANFKAAPAAPAVDAETVKKAARYDWLRDFHNGPDGVQANLPHIAAGSDNDLVWALIGEDADAGIDAAIAAQAAAKGAA